MAVLCATKSETMPPARAQKEGSQRGAFAAQRRQRRQHGLCGLPTGHPGGGAPGTEVSPRS
eukprot:438451-Alexandrium_andersonii.AAC.1